MTCWSKITNNQCTLVVNFHKDFTTSMNSGFFQGEIDKVLIYWPNLSGEILLSKQEEENAFKREVKYGLVGRSLWQYF
jgi:hypothetical protein